MIMFELTVFEAVDFEAGKKCEQSLYLNPKLSPLE